MNNTAANGHVRGRDGTAIRGAGEGEVIEGRGGGANSVGEPVEPFRYLGRLIIASDSD